MNKIKRFPSLNKNFFLASLLMLGTSYLSGIAESSGQDDPTGTQTSKEDTLKDSQDTTTLKNSEHPVRDTLIEAGKKTARAAGDVLERARKGIHAATEDSKKEETSRKSEDESIKEAMKNETEVAKDKVSRVKIIKRYKNGKEEVIIYENGKEKAEEIKNKTGKKLEEEKEKAQKAKDNVSTGDQEIRLLTISS